MAQQHTRSTPPGEGQHIRPGAAHSRRVGIGRLPHRILLVVLPGYLFSPLPALAQGAASAGAQTLLQPVQLDQAGLRTVNAGGAALGQQPRADWLTGLVEFLSAVPPECRAVPGQHPKQECQQRERGVLERFKERHPVAFNLVVAGLTLLAGFYVGGGFQGGR